MRYKGTLTWLTVMSKSITEPFTRSVIPGSKLCNAKWSPVLSPRSYGVMVSTLDFESSDPSSNLGRTSIETLFVLWVCIVFNTGIMEAQNHASRHLKLGNVLLYRFKNQCHLFCSTLFHYAQKRVMYLRKSSPPECLCSPHFTSTSAMMIPSDKSTFSAMTSRTRTQLPPLRAQILCLWFARQSKFILHMHKPSWWSW